MEGGEVWVGNYGVWGPGLAHPSPADVTVDLGLSLAEISHPSVSPKLQPRQQIRPPDPKAPNIEIEGLASILYLVSTHQNDLVFSNHPREILL